jgi:hypothetical protein
VELSKGNYKEYKRQVVELRKKNIETAKEDNVKKRVLGKVQVWGNKKSDGTNLTQNERVGWGPFNASKLGDFYREGYLCVLPNAQHGSNTYKYETHGAVGYPSLSPKKLGPVLHGVKCLPQAKTIEDYHQLSKVFKMDLDSEQNTTVAWFEQRRKGYEEGKGERHSPSKGTDEGNAPEFSVYYNLETGDAKTFDYIQCRLFYCVWMEHLAPLTDAFKDLQEKIRGGTNVLICGYDGYAEGVVNLDDHYKDETRPFGHEVGALI